MYVGRPRPPTSYRHWREKRPPGVKVNADVCRAPEAPNFNVENWVVLSVEIWAFFMPMLAPRQKHRTQH